MLKIILARLHQGHRTIPYPAEEPTLPDRLRGLPVVDSSKCPQGCRDCADACPTDAISFGVKGLRLDLGRCLFCTDCMEACPEDAIIKLGKGNRYKFNYNACTGCAVCFEQCPCHAIEMIPEPTNAITDVKK